jgi:hypothetical protein
MGTENTRSRKNEQTPSRLDLECVWVKAGVIGSKVCDMNFDCEKCPLDIALHQGFRGPREEGEVAIPVPAAGVDLSELGIQRVEIKEKILNRFFHQLEQFSLRDDRYYFRSHTWVRDGGGQTTTMGVDDFAARLLRHANSIVFPSVGSCVQQGEYCSWFVSPEGTIAFVSPCHRNYR